MIGLCRQTICACVPRAPLMLKPSTSESTFAEGPTVGSHPIPFPNPTPPPSLLTSFLPSILVPSPSSYSLVGYRRVSCDSHAYSLNCSNRPVCSITLITFNVPSLVIIAYLMSFRVSAYSRLASCYSGHASKTCLTIIAPCSQVQRLLHTPGTRRS